MSGRFSQRLVFSALFALAGLSSASASTAELIDANIGAKLDYPRTAIGKLVNETGAWCSGVVVSEGRILTAAHCLFNRRTGRFIPPESLHFLLGYNLGHYVAHVRISSYEVGTGFDPNRYGETVEADLAVLNISGPLPAAVTPIALTDAPLPAGTTAMIVGYAQSRAHAQSARRDCVLRDDIIPGKLMQNSCEAEKGFSGAPILVQLNGELRIAGIQVAALRTSAANNMLAIPAEAFDRMMTRRADDDKASKMVAEASCVMDQNTIQQFDCSRLEAERRILAGMSVSGIEETQAKLLP